MAILYVGADQKRFLVHLDLLCTQSKYFENSFSRPSASNEIKSLSLPDVEPDAIALMVGWLYRGIMPIVDTAKETFSFSNDKPSQPLILNRGTPEPFVVTNVYDNGSKLTDAYQNICFQLGYTGFSLEELRLADYGLNRRYHNHVITQSKAKQRRGKANTVGNSRHPSGSEAQGDASPGSLENSTSPLQADISTGRKAYSNSLSPSRSNLSASSQPSGRPPNTSLVDIATLSVDGDSLSPQVNTNTKPRVTGFLLPECEQRSGNVKKNVFHQEFNVSQAESAEVTKSESGNNRSVTAESAHQLALLHLVLFASRVEWSKLFQIARTAYMSGETTLSRPIPPEHVNLIYSDINVKKNIRLRTFSMENIFSATGDPRKYLKVAQGNEAFLADLLANMKAKPATK